MTRLQGKVALITGGARGQGRAIAAKFAAEGADVAICDAPAPTPTVPYPLASADDLAATGDLIRQSGRRCLTAEVDVRDAAALEDFAAKVVAELGRIDILCPNAGVISFGGPLTLTPKAWQDVLDINLTGVWNTVQAVAPTMVEQGEGCMLLTTSTCAREALPNMAHYVASKHGVLGLMRALALELGQHGIRVNAVSPGVIGSPMGDNDAVREMIFGRPDATWEEYLEAGHNWTALRNQTSLSPMAIADAMIWLASAEASTVTGAEIPVDAGHMVLAGYNTAPVVDEGRPVADYQGTALGPS
jgi:SDR family mycofactocin-dependent oxidoreductase